MDHILSTPLAPAPSRQWPLRRLLGAMALRRSRHRLSKLDDHLLRDIGLTREQAVLELDKGCWDAPDHWLR